MERRAKITVIGSYNTDLVVRTPRMPAPGETILGGPYFSGPGGKGSNQAVAAARLGAEVTLVAKLGRDHYGDAAVAYLQKEGIDTGSIIRSADSHTGVAFIVVDQQGENLIVVASGANLQLTPAEIEQVRPVIAAADMLVLQLEIPLESVRRAAEIAAEQGVPVLLNPAPGQPLDRGLLAGLDYLTPNESEAALITGSPVSGAAQAEVAARQLLEQGVRAVVVTMGARGALAASAAGVLHASAPRVQAVDTTGAGDAFNGAFAVALAEGVQLEAALRFATGAAALQVTRQGTAEAMPYRAEVDKFLKQQQ